MLDTRLLGKVFDAVLAEEVLGLLASRVRSMQGGESGGSVAQLRRSSSCVQHVPACHLK